MWQNNRQFAGYFVCNKSSRDEYYRLDDCFAMHPLHDKIATMEKKNNKNEKLTRQQKAQIDAAVKKTVRIYGKTLQLLAKT